MRTWAKRCACFRDWRQVLCQKQSWRVMMGSFMYDLQNISILKLTANQRLQVIKIIRTLQRFCLHYKIQNALLLISRIKLTLRSISRKYFQLPMINYLFSSLHRFQFFRVQTNTFYRHDRKQWLLALLSWRTHSLPPKWLWALSLSQWLFRLFRNMIRSLFNQIYNNLNCIRWLRNTAPRLKLQTFIFLMHKIFHK